MKNYALRWWTALVTAVLFANVNAGCTFMNLLAPSIPTVTIDGRRLLADTRDRWEVFVGTVDTDVKREARGEVASGGWKTWDERWESSIMNLRLSQQNAQKYVDYIVAERRRAGLCNLKIR